MSLNTFPFSSHFTHSLAALCTAIILFIAGWLGLRHILEGQPQTVTLRPQDKERVSYNSVSHILTVTTAKETTKSYARGFEIVIEKSGEVIVKKHIIGFERSPFMAIGTSFDGISLKKNGYVGFNFVELWRFDLGPALALGEVGVRPLVQVQYNVISNTSIMTGWWFGTYHIAVAVKF